jgi:hypothetical protein
MQHQQVIENFINQQTEGRGTYLKADADTLRAEFSENYRPYGRYYSQHAGSHTLLAVRLEDGGLLVNGAGLPWWTGGYQMQVIRALEQSRNRFSVIPFHSVVAAWTGGQVREWDTAPIPIRDLKQKVEIVVPSTGEQWRKVTERDKHGRSRTRKVHTLGDTVVRVRDAYYLSGVDPTGTGRGMYFLAELYTDHAPQSLADAFDVLKPEVVRQAEAQGRNVPRQGEWFAIPTKHLTSELMRDVERGVAVYRQHHVLGRDGHHEVEEAVIYRVGDRKGEVYARGVLSHTKGEHHDLDLGAIRWHLVVHNNQGASYTLTGSTAQFD